MRIHDKLGISSSQVMRSMTDVSKEKPLWRIPLKHVGIANKKINLLIYNPFAEEPKVLPIHMDMEMEVSLSKDFRGIHMSRMETNITELYRRGPHDILDFSRKLAESVARGQNSEYSRVRIDGFLNIVHHTPVSELSSIDPIQIVVHTQFKQGRFEQTIGLEVVNITACPCTLNYSIAAAKASDLPLDDGGLPTFTHTQRTRASLWMTHTEGIGFLHLYEALSKSLCLVTDLLKRPDEFELVFKTHEQSQFVEDCVRMIARTVYTDFKEIAPGDSRVFIKCYSLESIHSHDVYAVYEGKLGELESDDTP